MNVYKLIYDYIDGVDVKTVIAKNEDDCFDFYNKDWENPRRDLRIKKIRKAIKGEKRGVLIDTIFIGGDSGEL